MGEDPEAANYVQPAEGDVWGFIQQVGNWLKSPERHGIPT